MTQDLAKAIQLLFSLELNDKDAAFLFLGYSGIMLRLKSFVMVFDPGKSLGQSEIPKIESLNLLLFTHNHWDHFHEEKALLIIKQTGTHVVADIVTSEALKSRLSPERFTIGDPGSSLKAFDVADCEVIALRGVHVGSISQYLVKLEGIEIFHVGDSGYWRHPNVFADIAFVPTGTARTCSPAVALTTVMDLQPKLAVPIHGKKQDLKKFKDLVVKVLPDTDVIVPERFKPAKVHI
jgi:L-ascorbate metabolism protein UlaG (beta-lactamase superfamily)